MSFKVIIGKALMLYCYIMYALSVFRYWICFVVPAYWAFKFKPTQENRTRYLTRKAKVKDLGRDL